CPDSLRQEGWRPSLLNHLHCEEEEGEGGQGSDSLNNPYIPESAALRNTGLLGGFPGTVPLQKASWSSCQEVFCRGGSAGRYQCFLCGKDPKGCRNGGPVLQDRADRRYRR